MKSAVAHSASLRGSAQRGPLAGCVSDAGHIVVLTLDTDDLPWFLSSIVITRKGGAIKGD